MSTPGGSRDWWSGVEGLEPHSFDRVPRGDALLRTVERAEAFGCPRWQRREQQSLVVAVGWWFLSWSLRYAAGRLVGSAVVTAVVTGSTVRGFFYTFLSGSFVGGSSMITPVRCIYSRYDS